MRQRSSLNSEFQQQRERRLLITERYLVAAFTTGCAACCAGATITEQSHSYVVQYMYKHFYVNIYLSSDRLHVYDKKASFLQIGGNVSFELGDCLTILQTCLISHVVFCHSVVLTTDIVTTKYQSALTEHFSFFSLIS